MGVRALGEIERGETRQGMKRERKTQGKDGKLVQKGIGRNEVGA